MHLGKWLATYDSQVLDAKAHNTISYFEIPDDFALQNARVFCRKAINEMKEIQNKREKRERVQQMA